jgi:hypothetical protein
MIELNKRNKNDSSSSVASSASASDNEMNAGEENDDKSKKLKPPARQLAGPLRQIGIVFWKNLLLYKANKCGIICEILFSSIVFILLLLAYYQYTWYRASQLGRSKDVFKMQIPYSSSSPLSRVSSLYSIDYFYSLGREAIFYYPNNSFIHSIVQSSFPGRTLMAFNQSTPMGYNSSFFRNTYAFVSFPAGYNSIEDVVGSLNYTIYTIEYNSNSSFFLFTEIFFICFF